MDNFLNALGSVLTPEVLVLIFIGTFVGIIFGAIPGLNTPIAVALLLPFSYKLGMVPAMALLLGVYMGGISGGLVSAILLRIPGTAAAIATTSRQIFVDYALPLVAISAAMVLVNLFVCFVLGRRWLQDNPFETGVGLFGMACGVLATGLMLTKVMDPDNETTAATCISTSSTLGYAWQIPYMVVGSIAIFTAPTVTTIVSASLLLFFLVGGEILFGRKKRAAK